MTVDPKTHKQKIEFILREMDLDIKFFKPFAPGHKAVYYDDDFAIQLTHIPTCIKVQCSESQDRDVNIRLAKTILQKKLDAILNKQEKEYVDPQDLKKRKVKHHEDRHQAKHETDQILQEAI